MDKEDFDKQLDEDMFLIEAEQDLKEHPPGGPGGGCFSGCLYVFLVLIGILLVIGIIYIAFASSCRG